MNMKCKSVGSVFDALKYGSCLQQHPCCSLSLDHQQLSEPSTVLGAEVKTGGEGHILRSCLVAVQPVPKSVTTQLLFNKKHMAGKAVTLGLAGALAYQVPVNNNVGQVAVGIASRRKLPLRNDVCWVVCKRILQAKCSNEVMPAAGPSLQYRTAKTEDAGLLKSPRRQHLAIANPL